MPKKVQSDVKEQIHHSFGMRANIFAASIKRRYFEKPQNTL